MANHPHIHTYADVPCFTARDSKSKPGLTQRFDVFRVPITFIINGVGLHLKPSLLTQSVLGKELSKESLVSCQRGQVRERGRMRMMLHFNKTTEKMG